MGTFTRYPVAAVVATAGIILAALYILVMYQRTMTGPATEPVERTVTELRGREVAAIAPLLAIIIALGFVPQVLLDVINPAVDRTMAVVGMTDPAPTVPVAEAAAEGVQK